MRTETVNICEFVELTPEIQEKIIKKFREDEVTVDHGWWKFSIDDYSENFLNKIGFENTDIEFSGFWSQSDGASFTCNQYDHQRILDTLFLCHEGQFNHFYKDKNDLRFQAELKKWRLWAELIETGFLRFHVYRIDNHYSHKHTITAEAVEDFGGLTHKCYQTEKGAWTSIFEEKCQIQELSDMFECWVKGLCDEIYSSLEKEHDYLTSDEYIKEFIIDNEYEFTEKGEMWS